MRIVIQRVSEASVAIAEQETTGGRGCDNVAAYGDKLKGLEGSCGCGCDNVAAYGDGDGLEGPTAPKRTIGKGFVILIGVCEEDTEEDVEWLVRKVAALRVFDDDEGVMNRSILDIGGECLVVSQFTLFASYKKGNRPSWFKAARHEISIPLYESFCRKLSQAIGKQVATGEFGAMMQVALVNDGPVTICMDTKNKE